MLESQSVPSKPPSRLARILRASSWSAAAGAGGYILRIASSLVLTRLLVPEMFGVIALATMVQVICSLLSDIGLREAIIHSKRGDSPALLNTAWTLQVIRGCVIWSLCLVIALLLYVSQQLNWIAGSNVYAAAELPWVLAAATFASFIQGFRSTKWITANRDLELKTVTQIELLSHAIGILFMIAIAWSTGSIWALVSGGLITSAINVWLSDAWLPGVRNRFHWDTDSFKELISYGKWVLVSSVVYVIGENADRLLLGVWVSPAVLGFYVLAVNIKNIVTGVSNRMFSAICMPALSEIARNDPKDFSRLFQKMRFPFDVILIASAGAMFAVGQSIIDLLYDPRYQQTGEIVQILSFSVVISRYGICDSAYLARGLPRNLSTINIVKLISIYIAVPIGYFTYGFTGALWAIALHELPTVPVFYWLNRQLRLDNLLYEVLIHAWWPLGYLAGLLMVPLIELVA